MRERGTDIDGWRSKHLNEFAGHRFDYVVSLYDRVCEERPELPGHADLIHWSVPDSSLQGDSDREIYPAFERTATELATRIAFPLELIKHNQSTQGGELRM